MAEDLPARAADDWVHPSQLLGVARRSGVSDPPTMSDLEFRPDGSVDLSVSGFWSEDDRQIIANGRADGIILNYARGFAGPIPDFAGLPIRRLAILDRSVRDLRGIYDLAPTLEALSVQTDASAAVELDRPPSLRHVTALWAQIRASIRFAGALESVSTLAYDKPDLTPFEHNTNLVSASFKERPGLQTLDGLENLPWLQGLNVHLARSLVDISALERVRSPVLTTLQLEYCRGISRIDAVASCLSLEYLNISENGDTESLEPVASLVRLGRLYLYGSTNIRDGDLAPVLGLPALTDFRAASRRRYRPAVADIHAAIARRAAG